jgi:hypothetical protein
VIVTSILITATGSYFGYFQRLLPELLHYVDSGNFLQIVVATDSEIRARSGSQYVITPIRVQAEAWPHSTTKRYRYFQENWEVVKGQNIVWIDADMKIVSRVSTNKLLESKKLYLSLHPGFSTIKTLHSKSPIEIYKLFKRFFYSKFELYIGSGGWERGRVSAAFIPLWHRKQYFQGGFWIASNNEAFRLISFIAKTAQLDLENIGRYARHNDESYLNKYAVVERNSLESLPYGFVTANGYFWNPKNERKVVCLDKIELEILVFP